LRWLEETGGQHPELEFTLWYCDLTVAYVGHAVVATGLVVSDEHYSFVLEQPTPDAVRLLNRIPDVRRIGAIPSAVARFGRRIEARDGR
jgi:hypothetical protein